jgi:hypothetical protein
MKNGMKGNRTVIPSTSYLKSLYQPVLLYENRAPRGLSIFSTGNDAVYHAWLISRHCQQIDYIASNSRMRDRSLAWRD